MPAARSAAGRPRRGRRSCRRDWYFGEGATGPFFHCFLSLLNPGTTAATATVTYHLSDGSTASKAYDVPAQGRRTVYFNAEAAAADLSALATGPVWFTVSSTQPILGERAMWWPDWPWYEGHAAPGSTTSAVSWAVPEGRDGGETGEQTYMLIGNTTTTPGQVRLTLIPDTGAASTQELPIGPGERLTVNVGRLFGLTEARFSVIVDSLGTPGVPLAVDYARYRSVNGVPFSGGGAAPAIPVPAAAVGDTAPTVMSTTPAANATGVAIDANLTVTFSEPVTAGAGAFVLECPAGTPIALTNLTPSPATTFTLDPSADLPILTACTLRIVASQITDVDTTDPPDAMAADVVVPFTTSACSTITVSPTTVPGGTLDVAVRPGRLHADRRHRAGDVEPHGRRTAGRTDALGGRRARGDADCVRAVHVHRDGDRCERVRGVGAAHAVDPVRAEPGAVVHGGRRPDRARGWRPAGDRVGNGDQPGSRGRERPGRDVRRHRQHQPGALQPGARRLADRDVDLHAGGERDRQRDDHGGAAGQRRHARRRRRHVRPPERHDHADAGERRAGLHRRPESDGRRRSRSPDRRRVGDDDQPGARG